MLDPKTYQVIVTFKAGHELEKKYYHAVVTAHVQEAVLVIVDKDGDSFMVPIANIDHMSMVQEG